MTTDRIILSRPRYVAPAPRIVECMCRTCHGDCYVETDRGERRCPTCKGTGIVAVEVSK